MGNLEYTTPSPSLSDARGKAWWANPKFWLGIACSALFLFLAFRNVEWTALGAALHGVDWRYLSVATVVFVLKQVARSLRWRVLLAPLGSIRRKDAFAYLNIGLMANNLLPLRAGEIVRTVLLGEKTGFSKGAVLATVVVERLLDVLVVVAMTLILMVAMPIPPLLKQSALVFGGIACLGMVALWCMADRRLFASVWRWFESNHFAHRWSGRLMFLAQKVLRLGHSFVTGLALLRSAARAGAAVVYSSLAWGLAATFTWLVLQACHLDLPWPAAFMVIVLVNFGSAIPSAPGFIGVAHFLAVLALEPWAVEPSAALGFAIVWHAQSFLIGVVLGMLFFALERKSFGKLLVQPTAIGSLGRKYVPL